MQSQSVNIKLLFKIYIFERFFFLIRAPIEQELFFFSSCKRICKPSRIFNFLSGGFLQDGKTITFVCSILARFCKKNIWSQLGHIQLVVFPYNKLKFIVKTEIHTYKYINKPFLMQQRSIIYPFQKIFENLFAM